MNVLRRSVETTGVKQPFLRSRIDGTLRLDRECLLFSKADAQVDGFSERQQAANGHKRTSVRRRRVAQTDRSYAPRFKSHSNTILDFKRDN